MKRPKRLIVLAILAFSGVGHEDLYGQSYSELDTRIPLLMEDWKVPGLAIAIVEDGEVVFNHGYGFLEAGGEALVDPNTLFAIGSITKSFTAACVGLLMEEGRLDWDSPVSDHLPNFWLKDPWVSRHATIRDFLSHRSGIEPNNLVFWGTDLSRAELIGRMRYLDIGAFRGEFRYNNLTYLAVGETIPAVSGQSWADCVERRILGPLDMKRSTSGQQTFEGEPNIASEHRVIDGEVLPRPRLVLDNVAPSGAIHSSAVEMARWLLVHLGEGVVEGRQVLPERVVREMRTPQSLVRDPLYGYLHPGGDHLFYGLGWLLHELDGHKVVSHGGQTQGMTAQLGMMPDERFGYVILTNAPQSWLPPLLGYMVLETYLGGDRERWTGHFEAIRQRTEEIMAAQRAAQAPQEPRPALPFESYVGTYHDSLYGRADVALEIEHLSVELTDLGHRGTLAHSHGDVFEVSWEAGDDSLMGILVPRIQFRVDSADRVEILSLADSEFTRVE